jgi:hypothetical protein
LLLLNNQLGFKNSQKTKKQDPVTELWGQLRGQSATDSNKLLNRMCYFGAGNGIRTRDLQLGKLTLYH